MQYYINLTAKIHFINKKTDITFTSHCVILKRKGGKKNKKLRARSA